MTTSYLTAADLAAYLGVDESAALAQIVILTGNLVDEALVGGPTEPPAAWVTAIAWNVAIRAGSNPKGVTSTTRSWDDLTKTDRWSAAEVGVYLTDAESAALAAVGLHTAVLPVRSIRMNVPGWTGDPCRY